jgi:hypothetical protein
MAPNRKNIVSLDLPAEVEGLRNNIQSKYLPLTDPREQDQEQHQNEQLEVLQRQPNATDDASASYWEWSTDTEVNDEEENKVAHLFSVQRIESNLIKDAQKYVTSPSNKVSEHDAYWADDSQIVEKEQTPNKPQHVSDCFWYWPANDKIYKEEVANKLTSCSNIESNLRSIVIAEGSSNTAKKEHDRFWTWTSDESRHQIKDIPAHSLDPNPSFDYWTWDTISPEDVKKKIIETILEEERIRQLLSSEHIEEQLRKSSFQINNKEFHHNIVPAVTTAGYWDW